VIFPHLLMYILFSQFSFGAKAWACDVTKPPIELMSLVLRY